MTSKDNGDTKVREARMSEVKQKRNSTIDALRLLCIFLVIESHVYLSFFPRPSADNHAAFGWMVLSCLMCTLMSLNNHGFMAISGYYGVKLNVRKIFGFCYMIWFYSVIGLALSLPGLRSAEGGVSAAAESVVKSLFPVMTGKYWYATAYVILLCVSPGINYLAERCDTKAFRSSCIGVFVLFLLIPTFLYWGPNGEYTTNFVVMITYYMLIRYIRLHTHLLELSGRKLAVLAIGTYAVMVLLNLPMTWLVGSHVPFGYFVPFARGCTVGMFVFSLAVTELCGRHRWYNRAVTKLAGFALPAYIIDITGLIRPHTDPVVLAWTESFSWPVRLLAMVVYVIAIYLAYAGIESLRRASVGRLEEKVYQVVKGVGKRMLRAVVNPL